MTPRDDRAGNEAQIRQLLDDRVKAVRAKDVTAVTTAYAPDVVAFDLAPPLEYPGGRRQSQEPGGVVPDLPGAAGLRDP